MKQFTLLIKAQILNPKYIFRYVVCILIILFLKHNLGICGTTILDEFNGTAVGNEYGISYAPALYGQGAIFSQPNESRVQYPFSMGIPKQGTLEFIVKIDRGYNFWDYALRFDTTKALLFTTDIQHGDVTWPGSMWLYAFADGRIQLRMSTAKYGNSPDHTVWASGTNFRFNEWHHIGISFGSEGQWIVVDGEIVASNPANTQVLGMGGNHSSPVDIPTLGESVPGFWQNNRYEGGFEGIVECFRASDAQKDWTLHQNFAQIFVSIDTLAALPGDTLFVPINVKFPADSIFNSAEIKFSGYWGSLEFIDIKTDTSLTGDAGWTYQSNETDTVNTIWLAGATEISGEGVLCWLKFVLLDTASSFIPIILESALFNTGNIPVVLTSGGVNLWLVPFYGDVDLNGKIQAYDAAQILKYLVQSIILNAQQQLNADVSLDSTISALDATLIMQYGVGLIDSLPHKPVTGQFFAAGDIVMTDQQIQPGETISIPLILNNAENILSFEGKIKFNPAHLSYTGITWSEMVDGFTVEANSENNEIRFVGAGTSPNMKTGILAMLQFNVNQGIANNETKVELDKLRLNEETVTQQVATATLSLLTDVEQHISEIPFEYALNQNYPNPFNPATEINYQLPRNDHVELIVYNPLGQKIRTLVCKNQKTGSYSVQWDGKNEMGEKVPSGVYFYRLQAGEFEKVRKLTLLR